MAGTDDNTYGFSKADAGELVQLIGGGDGEYSEGMVRGGGSRSVSVFIGTLKENWGATYSQTANCDIKSFDGVTITDTGIDADVYDPLSAFAVLSSGDSLYITKQNGKYYAVNNAPCP